MSKGYGGFLKAWEITVRKTQARTKKKANSIFTTMSVAPADDEPGPGEIYHDEKVLENGEFYTGQFVDNLPHGHGKYLWTDGFMYVGEWEEGQKMGKGKFSWPSGATYEGDFKDDFMNGKGTYIGSSGETYKGSWVMNLKHGQGTKTYVNGDYYDGEWRRGLQNGQGRYQWKNGNNYNGQWRNGMINGNGTMVWSCGNRYDGYWEDGFPKGNGTFRWSDGSFYVGVWNKNVEEQSGTYYPSDTIEGNIDWDPQEVFSVYLNDCKICLDETVSVFPSDNMLNWPGMGQVNKKGGFEEGERPRISSTDGTERPRLRRNSIKRPGITISKGHKNYDLMLNLQLGIRYS